MCDNNDSIKVLEQRLRALVILDEVGSNNKLGVEAADALAQQREEIQNLKDQLIETREMLDGYILGR